MNKGEAAVLKSHQEVGTTISKSRLEEIKERGSKMERTIQLDVKIRPVISLYVGKHKLGTIEFDDLKDCGKFMRRLEKSIREILKNMKG